MRGDIRIVFVIVPENPDHGERVGRQELEIATPPGYDVSGSDEEAVPIRIEQAGAALSDEYTFRVSILGHAAPLYVYRVFGRPESPERLQSVLLDRLEERYRRHTKIAEVFDLRFAKIPNVHVREHLTAWITLNARLIHDHVAASIVVVRHPLLRWFLQAIWQIVPPPARAYAAVATPLEAISRAGQRLSRSGIEVIPAALERLHAALDTPSAVVQSNGH